MIIFVLDQGLDMKSMSRHTYYNVMLNYYKNGAELRPVKTLPQVSQSGENIPQNQYDDQFKYNRTGFDGSKMENVKAMYKKIRRNKYFFIEIMVHLETRYCIASQEALAMHQTTIETKRFITTQIMM